MKNPFENALLLAMQYPDTFERPSDFELNNLKINDYVKVCNSEERFWVKITEFKDNNIIGVVSNDLVLTENHGLKCYDEVTFTKDNIYSIN